ncbi:hypothetical protein M2447_000670 [Ereboglobus sp. PH5-10]|uniref:hypothetical protein n=1 Tax=Ereboglobus sp. PH5-10 TaxID=2940629 RepID=UPI0024057E45|nr:hypothetical protein [Ereboglobus sp. PH5-10]MDF9826589.1 hypothetical protein [Ereboglobus sp. PH5-10]
MNTKDSDILYTETPDRTPDAGPTRRGGTAVWFWTIVAGLAAIVLTVAGMQVEGCKPWAWMPAVALGAPCVYGIWCIYRSYRDRVDAPKSHNVLAGELGFDLLATCRGVAATAFFVPDSLVRSGSTTFFLFLENYRSRQSVVTVRLGHLPDIGRPEATYTKFHLAAGQAAVYAMPVRTNANILTGFHRLSVQITVEKPTGFGQKLSGTRMRIPSMRKLRMAVPFELAAGRPEETNQQAELPKPRYVSLASISEKEPTIERLHELVEKA